MSLPPPADPTPQTSGVPAGWYPDPGNGQQRWWDGQQWTTTFAAVPAPSVVRSPVMGVVALVAGVVAAALPWMVVLRGFNIANVLFWLAVLVSLVVGIVAIATRRGRGAGVVGLVLGLLGFLLNAFF